MHQPARTFDEIIFSLSFSTHFTLSFTRSQLNCGKWARSNWQRERFAFSENFNSKLGRKLLNINSRLSLGGPSCTACGVQKEDLPLSWPNWMWFSPTSTHFPIPITRQISEYVLVFTSQYYYFTCTRSARRKSFKFHNGAWSENPAHRNLFIFADIRTFE